MTLLLAGFFTLVLALAFGAGYLLLRVRPVSEAAALGQPQGSREVVASALHAIGDAMPSRSKDVETTRARLFRAGYRSPSAVSIFTGVRAALGVLCGVLMLASRGGGWIGLAIAAAGIGYMLPNYWLDWRTRARADRIRHALPATLDVLTLALEAGQSLDGAIRDATDALHDVYPDLCAELTFCHLEMRAGKSREDALRNLIQRSPEHELRKLASLIIDSERFGAPLGPALRNHARHLRNHLKFKAQESARKLTVKLVLPIFFLIFPAVLLVTLGPAYLQLQQFFNSTTLE
jgi:tight adherence protein C